MNNPLRSIDDYELFLYTLVEHFPCVKGSMLTCVRRGASLVRVTGEVYFDGNIRLVARERLLFHRVPGVIDWYGYEVWRGEEKLFWYDSQSHPNDPALQATHPHHKHIPPDVKHHRIPAPTMSFMQPNLPALIGEIEALLGLDGNSAL